MAASVDVYRSVLISDFMWFSTVYMLQKLYLCAHLGLLS